MSVKYFIDTNIFVYTFDNQSKSKQRKSQEIINRALTDHHGMISYQVVQEFLNVATRKFLTPLSIVDCRVYLTKVLYPLCEVYPSLDLFGQALEIQNKTGFSFYDSLIIAGAVSGGCKILYSEDFKHNQTLSGITVQNPFL